MLPDTYKSTTSSVWRQRAAEVSPQSAQTITRLTYHVVQFYIIVAPLEIISFLNVGERGVLRLDWIGAVVLIFVFLTIELAGRGFSLKIALPILLLIGATMLNTVMLIPAPELIVGFATTAAQAMFAIAVASVMGSVRLQERHIISLLRFWVLLACGHSMYAIYQAIGMILELPFSRPVILNASLSGADKVVRTREVIPGFYTPAGLFAEPSYLAQYLAPALIFLVILLIYGQDRLLFRKRGQTHVAMSLMIIALLLTTRLTAYLPPLMTLGLFWLDRKVRWVSGRRFNISRRMLKYAMLGLAALLVASLVLQQMVGSSLLASAARRVAQMAIIITHPQGGGPRLLASYTESISWKDRSQRAYEGLKAWWTHPLLGVGLNGLEYYTNTDRTHSSFVQILAEEGIVGFLAFLSIWLVMLRRLRKSFYRYRDTPWGAISVALFYMIVGVCILMVIGEPWFKMVWWFCYGMAALYINNVNRISLGKASKYSNCEKAAKFSMSPDPLSR